jgi:uncharacterized protein (DUF58 family)
MAESLWDNSTSTPFPLAAKIASNLVIASDFYASWDEIEKQFSAHARKESSAIIMMIADPAEIDFEYSGRVEFTAPDDNSSILVGHAEELKTAYIEKFQARKQALAQLAKSYGWNFLFSATNEDKFTTFAKLMMLAEVPK